MLEKSGCSLREVGTRTDRREHFETPRGQGARRHGEGSENLDRPPRRRM